MQAQVTVNIETLSRMLDIGARRVQQLAKEGILRKNSRGDYNLTESLLSYVKHLKAWRSPAEIPCDADDLAAYLGLTKGQVFYLAKIGAIPVIEHGRFDLATGIQGYLAFIREQYTKGHDGKAGRRAPWQSPSIEELEQASIMPLPIPGMDSEL